MARTRVCMGHNTIFILGLDAAVFCQGQAFR
ncbi:uncharacterized protein G2W53_031582 [Senna tora]|uniref:Uncharacterized protein n=1 Tax=Senna tora TaxID=362788 RepID=A0A834T8G7_9FABA|nr:uncharacterized protein G2W53_031582 [Senna tora]